MSATAAAPIPSILLELARTLHSIDEQQIDKLAVQILEAGAVFVAGAGRSGLMMRAFAMRLMHLGLRAYVVGETVPGYVMSTWYGAVAPVKVSREIVQRLNAEMVKALALPDVKEKLAALGADVVATTPEQTATIFRNDLAKFTKVAHEANIHAD